MRFLSKYLCVIFGRSLVSVCHFELKTICDRINAITIFVVFGLCSFTSTCLPVNWRNGVHKKKEIIKIVGPKQRRQVLMEWPQYQNVHSIDISMLNYYYCRIPYHIGRFLANRCSLAHLRWLHDYLAANKSHRAKCVWPDYTHPRRRTQT